MSEAKFILWSDVHVDVSTRIFDVLAEAPEGKYADHALLLAGDVADGSEPELISLFLTKCAEAFNRVFYTPGNHEYWGGGLLTLKDIVDEVNDRVGKDNVILLDRSYAHYRGCIVVGATLWTDYCNMRPSVVSYVTRSMAVDFGNMGQDPIGLYTKNLQDKGYIYNTLLRYPHTPIVVMTHHGCSGLSVDEQYNNAIHENTNYAYYSELSSDIIAICDKRHAPMVWVHGHMHTQKSYKIGDKCDVLVNACGYSKFETYFDPDVGFTLSNEDM